TNALLVELARKQAVHSPRCAINAKGGNVNLWELKTRKEVAIWGRFRKRKIKHAKPVAGVVAA
ncbi:MAG: hypothetical protein ACYCS8_06390, partial [Acidithiobacillus sp.]